MSALVVTLSALAAGATRTVIATPDAPAAIGPYSQGIEISRDGWTTAFLAGQIGLDPKTGSLVPGGIKAEAKQAMDNIKAIATSANVTMNDIVSCDCLMADLTEYADFNTIYAEYFSTTPPTRAAVQVVALPKNARVEVKCTAETKVKKTIIATKEAPAAIGPYSQGVELEIGSQELTYLSGQIGMTPSGTVVPGNITSQTGRVIENIAAIAKAADLSLTDIISCEAMLANYSDYPAFSKQLNHAVPVSTATAFVVSELPKDTLAEVKCIGSKGFNRKAVTSSSVPAPATGLVQGVKISGTGPSNIYVAGQIGQDVNGQLPDGIQAQAKQAMTNIQDILVAAGSSMDDIVECTCLLQDLGEYSAFNTVYATFFGSKPPARAAFQVVALPMNARVQVKCSAVLL
eukprot:TRINITY_DN1773_c0_g2_i1.p1 TRINITY_DN1773_c0_g2~~TRINITY_DN1773_c0_g2_i1.p1  ORF type:complete len:403 (+),score=91.55 TRINITY_DN1773_c0_g2_i1:55-1263(+)